MDRYPGTADINFLRQSAGKGQVISAIKSATSTSSRVIDGFVKAPTASAPQKIQHQAKKTVSAAHSLHQRAEHAHTLVRDGLKKPAVSLGARVRHQSSGLTDRTLRAGRINKHSLVDRFGGSLTSSPAPKEVKPPKAISGELINRNLASPKTNAPVLPSMVASASHQRLERLLDEALTKADSHKQAMKYQAARHFWQRPGWLGRRRGLKLSAAAVLVLAASLFVAWHKFPQLSLKVASMRAHITASIPTYKPEGFSVSPAKATASGVTIPFKSTSDPKQTFELTESTANMPSDSIPQTVIPKGTPVQTAHVDGNTIYTYGKENNAVWVNGGILYKLKNQANLPTDQINSIVKGLSL